MTFVFRAGIPHQSLICEVALGVHTTSPVTVTPCLSTSPHRLSFHEKNCAPLSKGMCCHPVFREAPPLLSPEGLPLLNLSTMGEREVLRSVILRSLGSFHDRITHGCRERANALRDVVEMRVLQVESSADRLNAGPKLYFENPRISHGEVKRYIEGFQDFRQNLEASTGPISSEEKKEWLLVYLDLFFHSRLQVARHWLLIQSLLGSLGMTWREALDFREARTGEYARRLMQKVNDAGGVVPFDDYFRIAMYDEEIGVYSSRSADHLIGYSNFFTTCSERPVYAEIILNFFLTSWKKMGSPAAFDCVEMGAGNGTLAYHVQYLLEKWSMDDPDTWSDLNDALRYHIVEVSSVLMEKQKRTLGYFAEHVQFHRTSAIHGDMPQVENGVFFSNELLDMFPPTKIVRIQGEYREIGIACHGGLLQEVVRPLRPETRAFLERHPIFLDEGRSYYLHRGIEAWLANIRGSLKNGYVLTVDYGDRRVAQLKKMREGSASLFRGNRRQNVFGELMGTLMAPDVIFDYENDPTAVREGAKDMTADPDFSILDEVALELPSVLPAFMMTQEEFSIRMMGEGAYRKKGQELLPYRNFNVHLLKFGGIDDSR